MWSCHCICNINVWLLYTWRAARQFRSLTSKPNSSKTSIEEVLQFIKWWTIHQYFTLQSFEKISWKNESLKKFGHKRLLPLLICRLHTVHDGFNKRILVFGQDCEERAFDLHSWFSQSLCKEGDYLNLAKDSRLDNESLFFQHLNKHWLISAPALERIKK